MLQTMPDLVIPGRGSAPSRDPGKRVISELAKKRVERVGTFMRAHDALLGKTQRKVRIVFSAGYAAGAGERWPDDIENLEHRLYHGYARDIGLEQEFGGVARFYYQGRSYSTLTDLAFAAPYLEPNPSSSYTPWNPLGIIAQGGRKGEPNKGHMPRCVDAAGYGLRILRNAVLPIIADGEDAPTTGTPEWMMRWGVRAYMLGASTVEEAVSRDARLIEKRTGVNPQEAAPNIPPAEVDIVPRAEG